MFAGDDMGTKLHQDCDHSSGAAIMPSMLPKPGEIWTLKSGDGPIAWVMIVSIPAVGHQSPTATVMPLSQEVAYLSDVDILIPRHRSGLTHNVLASTWLVVELPLAELQQPVGNRLSRMIYDCLMDIGDRHHSLTDKANNPDLLASLGLQQGALGSHQQAAIQTFHQSIQDWSQHFCDSNGAFVFTESLLESAIEVEQAMAAITKPSLSQWLQNSFSTALIAGWQIVSTAFNPPQMQFACRSSSRLDAAAIAQLIAQLGSQNHESQRREAAITLGHQAGNQADKSAELIQALVNLLRTTEDDETLWAGVESLWKLDPGNPAAGVRRNKLIDLGMQVAGEAVALAVAIVPKGEQIAVLLQVYPIENDAYLPADLKLMVLDDGEQILQTVTARQADVCIQLKLTGAVGERFGVRVAIGEVGLTESFVL
jgi:hypothetical protein